MSQSRALAPLLAAILGGIVVVTAGACGLEPLGPLDGKDQPPPYEEGLPIPDPSDAPEDPADEAPDHDAFASGDALQPADPPPAPSDPPPAPPPPSAPPDLAGCEQVRVVNTGTDTLNIRPDPSTAHAVVGHLNPGQTVDVIDIVDGQTVNGTSTWYEVDTGTVTGFVSDAFAQCVDASAPPPAPPPPPPPATNPAFPASAYLLPLGCGVTKTVTQGNNSSFSHNGGSRYAFDFGLALNTPLHAVHAGTVIFKSTATQPGDACYSGGGPSCISKANYITIKNNDGTDTLYAHINSTTLHVGDHVSRGDVVAKSGGTGYSTGPHAHVQRQTHCGAWWCTSTTMHFADVPGDHIPNTGDHVTSQNCP